ncbi:MULTISPECIES: hypothetical protein [unclassified Marinobacterium]|uniref:hypothetical protein n=1 Tax=unclassified Marinobacterium TaxID=2644139 RepID=UPI0015689FD6|nr:MULTISPECIES: hypothetical protein [unclassified Marinobacterium]NRP10003.1 hypothetical protein [Marinobacterium sp. xm-g-48]NRP48244.1 hypothetical protein [Marinobacterium sp. xm-d-543]NRP82847.1 hypothetical protein [Marinobacterium sp. xm-d-509]NRQ24364.1 hypothetical protein [Marinobacterium sp. xm-m-312]
MTRLKKQKRMANKIVLDKTPRKQERLADPDSYESRKQRAQKQKKKHVSVDQKRINAKPTKSAIERDTEAGRRGERKGGRLADKIRQYNADKKSAEKADNSSEQTNGSE